MNESAASPGAGVAAGGVAASKKLPLLAILRKRIRLVILGALALGYAGFKLYMEYGPHEWSGTVEMYTVDIGSRWGGRVKEVLVREGDRVEAGQPIIVLEPGDLEAQRLIALGQLEEAQAGLERTERGARPEEIEQANARSRAAAAMLEQSKAGARSEEIAAARSRLAAAQAEHDKAQADADRMRRLLSTQAVSKVEVDNAESTLRAAQAQRDALRDNLSQLMHGSRREEIQQAEAHAIEAQASAKLVLAGSRLEDIKAARAQVTTAQGKLESINIALSELTIRVPRAARVESLPFRPGDLLAPNATAARLVEEDQLYVRVFVPETEVGKAKIGSEVKIRVDSFGRRRFKGKFEQLNDVGEYTPRNLQTFDERSNQYFRGKIQLTEGRGELRPGMAAFILAPR